MRRLHWLYWVGIGRIRKRRPSATGSVEHIKRRPLHDFAAAHRDVTSPVGDEFARLVAVVGSGIGRVANAA